MSNTPLSDKITLLIHSSSDKLVADFQLEFLRSRLGLVMHELPDVAPGETFTVGETENPSLAVISDPTGRPMIKACADPEVFERTYSPGNNAIMTGKELLEMLLKVPDVDGVLVCSATSFNSYPIYRDVVERLLSSAGRPKVVTRRWWQFWKPEA